MKRTGWRFKLGLGLVLSSVALLLLHYVLFRDARNLAFYDLQGITMLPLEVLVVTLLLNSVLERRTHEEKMQKLHMVIGAFFGEVGTGLLQRISALDETVEVREHFLVDERWDARRYQAAKKAANEYDYAVRANTEDLRQLRTFIAEKRPFLLGLLQNPSLLEHESFTDALWAVTHLAEELEFRDLSQDLPDSDGHHLNGDIKRVYAALAVEWLDYVRHLQVSYPYLFSLAVRRNPLDSSAKVTVGG